MKILVNYDSPTKTMTFPSLGDFIGGIGSLGDFSISVYIETRLGGNIVLFEGPARKLSFYSTNGKIERYKKDSQSAKEPTIVSVIRDLQHILQIKPIERVEDEIEEFRTQNNFADGNFQGYTGIGPE